MKNQFIGDNLADEGMLCYFVTLMVSKEDPTPNTNELRTTWPPRECTGPWNWSLDKAGRLNTFTELFAGKSVCGGCSFHSGLKIGLFFSRSTLVFWQRCLRWSWIPRQILQAKTFVVQILLAGNRTPPGFWKQKEKQYCDCRCWLVPWHIIIQAVFALLLFDFERSLFLCWSSAVDHLSLVQKPVQVVHAVVCVGLGGNGSASFVEQLLS